MLKQLRRKFILMNMATVTVVVVAVLSAIGIASYQQSISQVYSAMDESLNMALRDQASDLLDDLSGSSLLDPFGFWSRGKGGHGHDGPPPDDYTSVVPQLGGKDKRSIPVAVYQVSDGLVATLISRVTTASLTDDLLAESVSSAVNSSNGQGQLPNGLFYSKRYVGGSTYIAFADSSSASGWQNLVLVLLGIGVLALLAFFVISLFFSKWALKPVEQAWEQQKQFVADASHELKTPITVILANMSIMLKHPLETVSSQSQWLESTQREAQGMQELVTDMLDLAKVESAQEITPHEPIDLSDLAEGCSLQFESVAFERNVMIEEDIDENIQVNAARSQLERLVTILLDNACKYAQPGSTVDLSLRVGHADHLRSASDMAVSGVSPKGSCAVLSVSNMAAAIDPEDLPHLFDRFYRSDKARVRTQGSYGLGLAIAAEIARAHGGCIAAQSTPSGQTTFTVAIPTL